MNYLLIGAGILVAVLLLVIGVQKQEISRQRTKIASLESAVAQCNHDKEIALTINAKLSKSVDQQNAAISALIDAEKATAARISATIAVIKAEVGKLQSSTRAILERPLPPLAAQDCAVLEGELREFRRARGT